MIDPESVKMVKNRVTGNFWIQKGFDRNVIPFDIEAHFDLSDVTFKCPYPHGHYFFYDSSDEVISSGSVALLMQREGMDQYLDLEVLYVGQSYGQDGDRTADLRLESHSTLQLVYAEMSRLSPDQEVWLILSTFEKNLISVMDGRAENTDTTDDEDDAHLSEVISTPLSEQQFINFTEAALIRYFSPEFNEKFKATFPSPAHTTYSECYTLDINSLMIHMETDELGVRLMSPTVCAKYIHHHSFPLHDSAKRKALLDVLA
ncbi:hypothetical protein [Burkholderia vietnamiensis]|uniref:hypothetical protein n=1 Tax=Burkholderia vietnamiensis TaxID=60552 RepID=UPI001B9D7121|nr:hypothetical protein [Burkholderia vietnamiensis]MBR7999866.1 hypothetical protein [Burkholderia vietnamiensis]